jgi:hypothetical protein
MMQQVPALILKMLLLSSAALAEAQLTICQIAPINNEGFSITVWAVLEPQSRN